MYKMLHIIAHSRHNLKYSEQFGGIVRPNSGTIEQAASACK